MTLDFMVLWGALALATAYVIGLLFYVMQLEDRLSSVSELEHLNQEQYKQISGLKRRLMESELLRRGNND